MRVDIKKLLQNEIDAVNNDDSLTDKEKEKEVLKLERDLREFYREYERDKNNEC